MNEVNHGKTQLIISYAAVEETTKKLMQRGNPCERIQTFWALLEGFDKVRFAPLTKEMALEGARVSITYGVPMLDALIAATAKQNGCDMLLSSNSDMAILGRKKYLNIKSW